MSKKLTGKWTPNKPNFKEECIFATANNYKGNWDYNIWEIKEVKGPDGWYLALLTGDGVEWGDIEDLTADLYMILAKPTEPENTLIIKKIEQ